VGEESDYFDNFFPSGRDYDLPLFTRKHIRQIIKKLRNNISPGHSGVTSKFLKTFARLVALVLERDFQRFVGGEIPEWWKRGTITLILKKGNLDIWRIGAQSVF